MLLLDLAQGQKLISEPAVYWLLYCVHWVMCVKKSEDDTQSNAMLNVNFNHYVVMCWYCTRTVGGQSYSHSAGEISQGAIVVVNKRCQGLACMGRLQSCEYHSWQQQLLINSESGKHGENKYCHPVCFPALCFMSGMLKHDWWSLSKQRLKTNLKAGTCQCKTNVCGNS